MRFCACAGETDGVSFEAALSKPAQCAATTQSSLAQMVATKADLALLAEDKCGRKLSRLAVLVGH